MSISLLSFKPGHDGSIAYIADKRLVFSYEAEKDSFPRYYPTTPDLLVQAGALVDATPDVICISGWIKGFHSVETPLSAGYYGFDHSHTQISKTRFFGKELEVFSSTHERSHIMCGYGLSPFEQGEPCYVLVWEGNIGDFYEVDEAVTVHHLGRVLEDPGNKYSFLFSIGDPKFPPLKAHHRFEDAGKLMALAAFSDRKPATEEERELIESILAKKSILLSTSKHEFRDYQVYNAGVESDIFKNVAGKFSDALFDRFYRFAKDHLPKRLPLIITGGCGLNCEWNSKWRDCGLFRDVFVPPCTNDTGSAIGTAVDAQLYYEHNAKISWTVYSGQEFEDDMPVGAPYVKQEFSYSAIADFLSSNRVLAWVQGRCEMGPRALGNRSILASPLDPQMHKRLNQIKEREAYRPIAPVCLESEAARISTSGLPSPHMLYFYSITTSALPAITHCDGSARLQTVTEDDNGRLFGLLQAFKQKTGFGVLCNTSLNFKGRGFINRTSDLFAYCDDKLIDGIVIGDQFYVRCDVDSIYSSEQDITESESVTTVA